MNTAITTKYLGPTNYHMGRIQARCPQGKVTLPYDYSISDEANHTNAMLALQEKLKWGHLQFFPAWLPDCMAWVPLSPSQLRKGQNAPYPL